MCTLASYPLLLLDKVRRGGAGRPATWPKIFESFCEVLMNAEFQNFNVIWFEIKYAYAEMKQKLREEK